MGAAAVAGKDLGDDPAARMKKAFDYIESFRHAGNSPGWNYFGNSSPFTVTEIAGWVVLAETFAVDRPEALADADRSEITQRIVRDLDEIVQRQDKNGGWRPIREDQPGFIRTYSSIIALWALIEARLSPAVSPAIGTRYDDNIRRGINWLLVMHRPGLGWVANPNRVGQVARFDGLTAQTLFVLSRAERVNSFAYLSSEQSYLAAKRDFLSNKEIADRPADKNNSSVPDIDIRFSTSEFMAEGSTFLWFPWTLAELSRLTEDKTLSETDRASAVELRSKILDQNYKQLEDYVETANLMYIYAENLYCTSVYLKSLSTSKDR